MPRNLMDTRTASFGDLISNGKIYRVPLFQRDYSWTEENWEDLWQDIEALYWESSTSHYMGAIVLQSSPDSEKELIVIDGQQRLATLSIIAIAVIEKLRQLVEKKVDPEANQERQEIIMRTYIGDKDPRSLHYSSRLILNANNNDFYESNLINLRKPLNIRSLAKSNQKIWQAYNFFTNKIEEIKSIIQDGEKIASFLTEIVAERLVFIQITVENELNAYMVFETLNARGIELSSTDLLKNYLFSLFQDPEVLEIAQSQWQGIINTVRMEKFPSFMRYYLKMKHNRVRGDRLFKLVREDITDAEQAFYLLDQLEKYSNLFLALDNPKDEFWGKTPENYPHVRALNILGVKQVYPVLFAAYQHFDPEDFTRVLKLAATISFRYSIVSSLNPNELDAVYNQVAIKIENGQIKSPQQVFNELRQVYVPDDKFKQDFSLLAISTKGPKKKLVRYILSKLEADASGVEVNEDSFSIEHILPQEPTDDWRQHFPDARREEMVDRLGNLTLLEPALNCEIGEKSYQLKREKYQQSVYTLTAIIKAEEWTADSIYNRQRDLARQAVHIWKSDFLEDSTRQS
ncbi:MAG: DUF262 domain-containing protein [Hormoscilla sp. GUM202]|nr:DUF262 domain-containing protein [Hormoscilla sp. GUM202]